MRRVRNQDGQALIEAALTIPLLLLVAVGIFEFGRAYQTWEILTNAAREGARMAILPSADLDPSVAIKQRVRDYMQAGQLSKYDTAEVVVNSTTITVNGSDVPASQVQINYPFDFIVFKPVALLVPGAHNTPGDSLMMQASVVMRNE
jgi:Flp pilus assembly protein TadG